MGTKGFTFPRLKRRGPIEARCWGAENIAPMEIFPRLKRRGPIEANQVQGFLRRVTAFPRLKRRGPIEAAGDLLLIDRDPVNFHV